jgi:hypothetical protein
MNGVTSSAYVIGAAGVTSFAHATGASGATLRETVGTT